MPALAAPRYAIQPRNPSLAPTDSGPTYAPRPRAPRSRSPPTPFPSDAATSVRGARDAAGLLTVQRESGRGEAELGWRG